MREKGTLALEEVRDRWKNAESGEAERRSAAGQSMAGEDRLRYTKGHADKRTNELIISHGDAARREGGWGLKRRTSRRIMTSARR